MEEQKIACIYYPTTVVTVDDNPTVLKNVQLSIGKFVPCKGFSIPEEALKYLENEMAQNNALKGIININEESDDYNYDSGQLPLQYNITQIYKNVYDNDRFSSVTLVIVDFAMPSMNGEEFCRKLRKMRGNRVKIIMLTGEADDPKAIQLFNEGVIDRFFRKTQEGVEESLKNCVFEMQNNFFKEITFPMFEALSSEKDTSLGDPAFIEFFNKTCLDLSATSYYLIEISGSFLFFNNAGKPTWLIIKTLNELKEISEQIESHISEELIHSLDKGEVVSYFGNKEIECYSNEERLKKSLHKAQTLKGKQEYRYALLDELPEFPLERGRILSFDQYISNL